MKINLLNQTVISVDVWQVPIDPKLLQQVLQGFAPLKEILVVINLTGMGIQTRDLLTQSFFIVDAPS